MKCPNCQAATRVLESRAVDVEGAVRRRRRCQKCTRRFTTYERLERPPLLVTKNDGSLEYFKYDKLLAGLLRSTKKTSMTEAQTEILARQIEQQIMALGRSQIKSRKIGAIAVEHLARTNKVAYLRFVTVYRRFKTLASFERELVSLKETVINLARKCKNKKVGRND